MLVIAPILALGCLWCTEPGASLPRPEPRVDLSPAVRCTADVTRHILDCEQSPHQPARISVVLSNARYDPRTLVYSFDSEITNLLPYPIGTPDRRSVTGLKVFVEAGPTATAFYPPHDTGTVLVRGAQGVQSFTGPGQPYLLYDTILAPRQVTRPKRWEFTVSRSVSRFVFTIRVFTFTPAGGGIPDTPPSGFLISADSVAKLYAFTNAVWTHPRASGPYPRNITLLFFTLTATREDRQSTIDMMDGQVIGGGGVYYNVLVPTATGDALWASIDRLSALRHVTLAIPDILARGLIPMTASAP